MWFRRYVSVGERAARAQRKILQLKKKNFKINPVFIEDNKIAKSWWAKAWINHLKHYADYDNRVSRGRSYVKNGMVIHFAIKGGHIEAMVMGTSSRPYKIKIEIKKLSTNKWNKIKHLSRKHFYTLLELTEGRLPEELKDIFSNNKEGIFPSLEEMNFRCSCPDWAAMCKHVSAVLFAIGVKIDDNIDLFFRLRGVDIAELVQSALKREARELRAKKSLEGVPVLKLSEKNLASLFDIQLVTPKTTRKKTSRKIKLH